MTARETIAVALAMLQGETDAPTHPLGVVVVRAWQLDTDRFGLPFFETRHPDSNRVLVELVKHKDLFRSRGRRYYELTDVGAALAVECRRRLQV